MLACLFAPLITQYTPLEQAVGTAGPSAGHWFGQDSLGRDLFSRLLYGGRWSLTIGLGSTFLALCAGALIGSVAATSRKASTRPSCECSTWSWRSRALRSLPYSSRPSVVRSRF
ncbi:hypothetical protein ACETU7_28535 [Rhodococcus sp. 3Y1]